MEETRFLYTLPSWALFALVVVLCILTAKAGVMLAQWRVRRGIKEPDAPGSTGVAAILGLLAFMLGFTFSLTGARFTERRELVIQEANAIMACYLRTSLLPEKQQTETRRLLHEYTGLLLNLRGGATIAKAAARLEQIHLLLWQQAASLVQEEMDSELRSMFISSVNEVIALFLQRKTVGFFFPIPGAIWVSLLLLLGMGMFSFGYQTGTFTSRQILDIPLLAVAFALVIVMIVDMDAVATDRMQVSQEPLKDIVEVMQQDLP